MVLLKARANQGSDTQVDTQNTNWVFGGIPT